MDQRNLVLTPRRAALGAFATGAAALVWRGMRGRMLSTPSADVAMARDSDTTHPAGWRHSDQIPNVSLLTQTGRSVRLFDDLIRDSQVLLSFMYCRCNGICPATVGLVNSLRTPLARELGPNVKFISITLDPEHDRPSVLQTYAANLDAADEQALTKRAAWYFLTGQPDDIEAVRRALGYQDPDPVRDADRTQHAAMITFGNDLTNRWGSLPVGLTREQTLSGIMRVLGTTARQRYAFLPQPTATDSI